MLVFLHCNRVLEGCAVAFEWSEKDEQAVRAAKLLAADAVENAGSGHPGTPISLASAAYLIYQRYLRFDPVDPHWLGRDRFVLSAGHASILQYIQLYMSGAGLELDDLKQFRQLGSKTPGHPEFGHTDGIEVTTGPLGSGFAAAVGMAMATRYEHGMLDPNTALGKSPWDHNVYVIAGDGDLQEGISSEAASLAGTQDLGNLIVIYDDNRITIEDDTSITFNEDVLARFASYGWHTQAVDWRRKDGTYVEDVEALSVALDNALAEQSRPSLIALSTIIGWPTPGKQDTGGIHGAKLGSSALEGLKEALGADPEAMFDVDEALVAYTREQVRARVDHEIKKWDKSLRKWAKDNRDAVPLLNRIRSGALPANFDDAILTFEPGKALSTRVASGKVINAIAAVMPEFWGGSADLAGSNNTIIEGAASFFPANRSSKAFQGNEFGRNIHFGVREHAMGGILNGIGADGLTRVYGATFFVFADYMRGAVRLAALMDLPVTYVWTHDSIGVGEDGPTHQPVEHLASYRAIPGLAVVRPGDADETAYAWKGILERRSPAALVLTRQNIPNPGRGDATGLAGAEGVLRGGYVIKDCEGTPELILMASGSELSVALAAADELAGQGVAVRVVSMPCFEWFEQQDQEYRESVLPPQVQARVSVEAGLAMPWYKYLGSTGRAVSIETFGAPGSAEELFEMFQLTPQRVVNVATEVLEPVADH